MKKILVSSFCIAAFVYSKAQKVAPLWEDFVQAKKNGKTSVLPDFSYAGYRGGGVQIPDPPIKISLKPKEGDNTDVIQAAINELAGLEPVNGFRGTILLAPGRYDCERTITINHSGIVLRGSGSGENGTVFNLTGKAHVCISIRGSVSSRTMGQPTYFSEAYVPSGTTHFSVKDISGLSVGDTTRMQ